MSIQQSYCRTIASQLDRHAVWEPGSPLKLGDYGPLTDGAFLRLGNIVDFELGEDVRPVQSNPTAFEFTSAGTSVKLVNAEARVDAAQQANAEAELRIKFARASSIYLRAARARLTEIENLRAISQALRLHDGWEYGWTIISGVRSADAFSLILSASDSAEVSLYGAADILKAFNSGDGVAQAALSVAGEAALKVIGASGPFLIDLVRLRRIWGGTARAAGPGTLAIKPYEVVPPASILV